MKELATEFIGIGEVRGFKFTQLAKNDKAYMYEVVAPENAMHYEVFERVENDYYGTITYPKSNSFGVWAWCISNKERAEDKFKSISK
jgi:hypothetical protein